MGGLDADDGEQLHEEPTTRALVRVKPGNNSWLDLSYNSLSKVAPCSRGYLYKSFYACTEQFHLAISHEKRFIISLYPREKEKHLHDAGIEPWSCIKASKRSIHYAISIRVPLTD